MARSWMLYERWKRKPHRSQVAEQESTDSIALRGYRRLCGKEGEQIVDADAGVERRNHLLRGHTYLVARKHASPAFD